MHTINTTKHINIYLANIPKYVKAVDLDAKCIKTLWYASRRDVWYEGDSFITSEQKALFEIMALIFSLAFVSVQ